jgi:hypothetical protein
MLMGEIGVVSASGMLIGTLEIKSGVEPTGGRWQPLICRWLAGVFVEDTAVGGIEPELKEGMRVRGFGAGSIVGGQETKT